MRAVFNTVAILLGVLLAARLVSVVTGFALPAVAPYGCGYTLPVYAPLRLVGSDVPTPAADPTPTEQKGRCLEGYHLLMTAIGEKGTIILAGGGAKNRILGVGERLEGYRLESVTPESARFVKGGVACTLRLKKSRALSVPESKKKAKKAPQKRVEELFGDQIQREGDTVFIPKELLKQMHDLKAIFKRITIVPRRRGRKLEGFLVTWVAKGSVFEKIGLRPRDLIVKVDGRSLRNEKEAMAYFARLDSISAMSLTIKRNNKEKVLKYEVY